MQISKMEIHGLRGFGVNQIIEFGISNKLQGSGLTILIGPNNAGKSTIVEALRAFTKNVSPSFTVGKRNAKNHSFVHLKLHNSSGEIKEIKSIIQGSSETEYIHKDIEPKNNSIFAVPSRRYFNPFFGKSTFTREQYITSYELPAVRGSSIDHFSYRLFQIQSNKIGFDEVLTKVLNPVPNWTIDQADNGNYFLKFINGDASHSSDGIGEGIVSLFFIIDAIYDSKPNDIIVIDEPELSLHPSLQKKLAELFIEYSADRQIIISTHSPYFVKMDSIVNGAKLNRVHLVDSNCKVSTLSPESINCLKGLLNNLNNPHILGFEAREVFFLDDKVVLVEGQEDIIFYKLLLKELNCSLQGDFYGWGVGGASNMKIISSILRDMGFKKVVGILDKDKEGLLTDLRNEFPNYQYYTIPAKDVRTKKAIPAKQEIVGLLDDKNKIRIEYKAEIELILKQINEHLDPNEGL